MGDGDEILGGWDLQRKLKKNKNEKFIIIEFFITIFVFFETFPFNHRTFKNYFLFRSVFFFSFKMLIFFITLETHKYFKEMNITNLIADSWRILKIYDFIEILLFFFWWKWSAFVSLLILDVRIVFLNRLESFFMG